MQHLGIGVDRQRPSIQHHAAIDLLLPGGSNIALFCRCSLPGKIEQRYTGNRLCSVHPLQMRLRHLAEVAEAPNDRLQISDLHAQSPCTFAKDLIELLFRQPSRMNQVLNRKLQWKERIFQLVGQPTSQLPPRSHALALDEL